MPEYRILFGNYLNNLLFEFKEKKSRTKNVQSKLYDSIHWQVWSMWDRRIKNKLRQIANKLGHIFAL